MDAIRKIIRESVASFLQENEEEIQTYIDVIDLDPDNPKYNKYKELLKTKYGHSYISPKERYTKEEEIIQKYDGVKYSTTTPKGFEMIVSAEKNPNVDRSVVVMAYDKESQKIGVVGFSIDAITKNIRIGGAYVEPDYRRKGVYGRLVDFVEKVAKENNLTIADGGRSDDAKAFWKNRGIQENFGGNKVWYHGSADARSLKNGFEQRNISTTYIKDPERMEELQALLKTSREAGDDKTYFKTLDQVPQTKEHRSMKAPLFFTDNRSVAQTYATDKQALDYQNSEPGVFSFYVEPGRRAVISAPGKRFRHIDIDLVKKGFVNSGSSPEEVEDAFARLNWPDNYHGKTTNTTIGLIAQELGYDTVDVVGVLDSYHGGNTRSTVRMVWDVNRIKPV